PRRVCAPRGPSSAGHSARHGPPVDCPPSRPRRSASRRRPGATRPRSARPPPAPSVPGRSRRVPELTTEPGTLWRLASVLGLLCLVVAYLLNQRGLWRPDTSRYLLTNVVG